MGKSTISMAIFNSYVSYYQRVMVTSSELWIMDWTMDDPLNIFAASWTFGHRLMWLMSRNQRIVQRGWLILIPHEDKVDVITRFNILAIEGGVLLARSAYWS